MIQIDGPRRHVYINFRDAQRMQEILTSTKGQGEYRHTDGEISKVRIEAVGLGMQRVRIANLSAKVTDRVLKMALGKYGEVRDVEEETWSRAYRYPVPNGIRIAILTLVRHIPSHILVAGYGTLISYEGQSTRCYGCKETKHMYQVCPHRKRGEGIRQVVYKDFMC